MGMRGRLHGDDQVPYSTRKLSVHRFCRGWQVGPPVRSGRAALTLLGAHPQHRADGVKEDAATLGGNAWRKVQTAASVQQCNTLNVLLTLLAGGM